MVLFNDVLYFKIWSTKSLARHSFCKTGAIREFGVPTPLNTSVSIRPGSTRMESMPECWSPRELGTSLTESSKLWNAMRALLVHRYIVKLDGVIRA